MEVETVFHHQPDRFTILEHDDSAHRTRRELGFDLFGRRFRMNRRNMLNDFADDPSQRCAALHRPSPGFLPPVLPDQRDGLRGNRRWRIGRPSQQIPLRVADAKLHHRHQLILGFHPFGDDLAVHGGRQIDQGLQNGDFERIVVDIPND